MKNYTVIGLFPSQENATALSQSLEKSGIQNEDYIIYKTEKKIMTGEKRNFWKKLLGAQETPDHSRIDKLITSVAVRSEAELDSIRKSFRQNEVVHIYEFQDMTLDEAKNLDYVKKIVELRAKSQIYAMPRTTLSRKGNSEGISTEVKA
ncbi:hypothetical protein [Kaistella palustris]|uniref:hypothetical protein n=1 Tax=Kaistella palustris TaxID=493376 RepID=UPI0003F9D670|nr:hypothetical protein [Kaistella palustris]